jgi:hypothetical protein
MGGVGSMRKYIITEVQEITVQYVVDAYCEQDAVAHVNKLDCNEWNTFLDCLDMTITDVEEVESESPDYYNP